MCVCMWPYVCAHRIKVKPSEKFMSLWFFFRLTISEKIMNLFSKYRNGIVCLLRSPIRLDCFRLAAVCVCCCAHTVRCAHRSFALQSV